MMQSRDEDIEARAIEMAQSDKLEWVKRPRQTGQPDTPAGATNAERNCYRDQARAEMNGNGRKAELPPTAGKKV